MYVPDFGLETELRCKLTSSHPWQVKGGETGSQSLPRLFKADSVITIFLISHLAPLSCFSSVHFLFICLLKLIVSMTPSWTKTLM